ncbi:MAG: hypothetical protein ACU0B1_09770 [Thermohalobaculum sp.]
MLGPAGVHAILIDKSDPITPLQAQRARQILDAAIERAVVGERVDLYVLAENNNQAMRPVISLCRPKSNGSELTENVKKLRQNYQKRFKVPLDNAFATLARPSQERLSPIMESIKAVCVGAFGDIPPSVPTQLTVVSDMIQYSPLLSHYKTKDFELFSASSAYREVIGDCHRAVVDVLYLVRPRDIRVQDREHQLFWEKFLDAEGAVLQRMEAI